MINREIRASAWLAFAGIATVLLGAALWGWYVLGTARLDINSLGWLSGDLAQVRIAWVQYVSDPDTGWLSTTRNSYPLPMSIALFDPMPLLLVLLKPLAQFVPDQTQYFGLYFLACFLLQGLFGYLVAQEILRWRGDRSPLADELTKVFVALLFLTLPCTMYRMLGQHTALSSQWLLALSIWAALRSRDYRGTQWLRLNAVVLFLACGFNPYLALMVGISLAGFSFIHRGRSAWRGSVKRVFGLGAAGALGLYVFGFLGGASVAEGGYGLYSMNILGPFDSNGFARVFKLDVDDATGGQGFEGFNYLGLGLLVLCAVAWALNRRSDSQRPPMPFAGAVLIVLLAYLLALSTTVTLSVETLQLPVPAWTNDLLSRFRASGRLFWLGAFWLVAISAAIICFRFTAWKALSILSACAFLQIFDVHGIAWLIRQAGAQVTVLQAPEVLVKELSGRSALIVLPPWQCGSERSPGGGRGYEIFGVVAATQHIPTNSFYAARTLPKQRRYHCDNDGALNNVDAGALYVLSKQYHAAHAAQVDGRFDCTPLPIEDRTLLCLPRKEQP
ncbi:DUF6311 domain-containing protein [Pseudomonas sp. N040]|uniref:DUF6311 domain-containing protein n=1 Tax=Pseudomonas sp. N040 TaxID=2785325 RepID=UPI0018A27D45|nr:DUF6311 domain-containing protein [Pseudomonas sp. N040]MBF7728993.1 hypothetical protein [Pseudomonas sp. N040]MBW7012633.1 hypothetical protein [Pseudomonas sp. N040]